MSEEANKPKKKVLFEGLVNKLKRIKHLDIILTVLFIAIILLIYFSTFSTSSNSSKSNTQQNQLGQAQSNTTSSDNALLNYASQMETKLEGIISQIKDAGSVKVIVTFDGEIQTVIAYTTKIEETENGTKVETKSPILVTNSEGQSEPIVLETIMPNIKSVVVVATGAKNTSVKLEILRAVQAVLNLQGSNIEIFAGI